MFRYSRTITVRNGASFVPALQAAIEIASYVNEVYGLKMKVGSEMFGGLKLHWFNDTDSLDAMPQFAAKVVQDKVYGELLEKLKPHVVDGSVRDRVVQVFG